MRYKSLLKLSILISTFLIFFGYTVPNQYIILGSILPFIIIYSKKIKLWRIKSDDILWIMCLGLVISSMSYSKDIDETIKYSIVIFIMLLVKILYSNVEDYKDYIVRLFYIASSIHVISTIGYIIIPDVIIKICSIILPHQAYLDNLQFYKIGSIAGITGQTGINVFYISIYIAIVYSKIVCTKNYKLYNIISLIIGFIALFLTAKRGPLITNIIVILLITIIFGNINIKNFIPKVAIFIGISIIGWQIISEIPQANIMIEKFETFTKSNDITNGRTDLWYEAISYIKMNPIIGIGAYATPRVMGEMTHNIYIQLILELGIIGFLFFALAMLKSFVLTLKNYFKIKGKKTLKDSEKVFFSISIYIQLYFLIYGISGNPLYGITFLMPYFISIAMGRTCKRIELEES